MVITSLYPSTAGKGFLLWKSSVIRWGPSGYSLGFPGGLVGKEYTCNAGDLILIPGSGRSPGEGNGYPLQYSCLENFMDRGDTIVHGITESDTTERLSMSSRSVRFSRSVVSYSLQPHGLQRARLPCPLPTPRAYSDSCPSSWWCHPTIWIFQDNFLYFRSVIGTIFARSLTYSQVLKIWTLMGGHCLPPPVKSRVMKTWEVFFLTSIFHIILRS